MISFPEIPANTQWPRVRARFIFRQRREKAKADDQQLTASQSYGVIPQQDYNDLSDTRAMAAIAGTENFAHVEKDDFVISLRSFEGGIEKAHGCGCISPAYTVMRPSNRANPEFFQYLLKSTKFIETLQTTVTGVRDGKSVRYDQFANIVLPLPDMQTQEVIAGFLERETRRIDALIAKKEQMIAALTEKRSTTIIDAVTGRAEPDYVPYSSENSFYDGHPASWKRYPMKFLFDGPQNGAWGGEPGTDDVDALCVRVADFQWDTLSLKLDNPTTRSFKAHQVSNLLLKEGDLVIEKSGGGDKTPVGRVVAFVSSETAVTSNFVARIRPKRWMDSSYLLYLLAAQYMSGYSRKFVKQNTGIQNLDDTALFRSDAWIPDLATQKCIAASLMEKTANIDRVIALTRTSIERLKEYRAALITAAVTGQIDVTTYKAGQMTQDTGDAGTTDQAATNTA